MSRLTKRWSENGCVGYIPNYNLASITNKLGKLEDLEDELGCPLEVVIKAMKEGIYYISPNGNTFLERSFTLKNYSSGWYLKKPKLEFRLEDYKKTFWLKRDKSE